MHKSVSEFIVGTCRVLPKSSTNVFESMDLVGSFNFEMDGIRIVCGSCAEFFIQPLHSCIDDIDYCQMKPKLLAFTDENPVLPYDVRLNAGATVCFLVEPYPDYPAFVRLRLMGQIRYNWERKTFEFIQDIVQRIIETPEMDENGLFNIDSVSCRVGPANRGRVSRKESISVDIVESIWCPQWPDEAKNWPLRRREYGWPTTVIIHEVIQNGCQVVFAKHPACRNDVHQCRLSFSVAEVILLQSWTKVQQIVYHMLRFFSKRELIKKDCPKENEVLCTYHFKTLMLWFCEKMSPKWWNSKSVIKICCKVFEKLAKCLKELRCPNYFIPEANLFHEHFNRKIVNETAERLIYYCDSDYLSLWFVGHYMQLRVPDLFVVKRTLDILSSVYHDHMLYTCEAMKADKSKAINFYVSSRFCVDVDYTHRAGEEVRENAFLDFCKYVMRIGSLLEYTLNFKLNFRPSAEIESCYWLFGSMLRTLHAAQQLYCKEMQYDSERFVELIRRVFIKPKFFRSKHHNLPRPISTGVNRSQLYFIKAQDLMENLTGSNNDLEFQVVSEISKGLLRKALKREDSKTSTNARSTLCYMAALHFAASDYQSVIDLCSRVIMNEEPEKEDKETLNAGCLLYIEDVSKIIGFYLIFMKAKDASLHYTKRQFFLDLRLTPEVFAHYLSISSNEKTVRPIGFGLNDNFQPPAFPLDAILINTANRKFSRLSAKGKNALRVDQRTDQMKRLEATNEYCLSNEERISQLLMEYSLQNLTSFYEVICKDCEIYCNVVDCYRAAYLYKCHRYPEVLHMCEQILNEPSQQRDLSKLNFANVMVLPPLDYYFDGEVQCLFGFHTLFCYLSSLYKDFPKTEETRPTMYKRFFGTKTHSDKCLLDTYFLGRHFLARYLKVRCLIDCFNTSLSEAMFEFKKLRSSFPFEHIIRCFLQQKLRQLQKCVNAKYCAGKNIRLW